LASEEFHHAHISVFIIIYIMVVSTGHKPWRHERSIPSSRPKARERTSGFLTLPSGFNNQEARDPTGSSTRS